MDRVVVVLVVLQSEVPTIQKVQKVHQGFQRGQVDKVVDILDVRQVDALCFRNRCRTSRCLLRCRRRSSCRSVVTVPTEKIDNIRQLQFSYEVVDVQLSRNDDCGKFRRREHH